MNEGVFKFRLDIADEQDGGSFDYQPWGTRSLKLNISTQEDLPVLRLRPDRLSDKPGICYGNADGGHAFIISWGGGHEQGPPAMVEDFAFAFERAVELKGNKKANTIFFNLTHIGPDIPETEKVTIKAFRDDGSVQAILVIKLQKPNSYSDSVIWFSESSDGSNHWSLSAGNLLPVYDSRWWPGRYVNYEIVTAPPIKVERLGSVLKVRWEDDLIAGITDLTNPTVLDQERALALELFHFDKNYVALRPWFFWLDKDIGFKFFFGRHEVPDAERFDMLINKNDGRVVLACTDLHWRESWGQVVDPPLEATIGLTQKHKMDLGREKLFKFFKGGEKAVRPRYNPLGYISRLAERLAQDDEAAITRAKGTEAHVPTLNNIQQVKLDDENEELIITNRGTRSVHEMTSSDVRLG
jgi:hypothetical protein